ncbi:hypothetical protein ABZ915_47730 [Streptomyces sp. NPDC046915]|uniref:hypothetical protein n=1 Tax=Streptomyces sp. NPDC046915 TaxID=3155257 RepID=UPI0033D5746C
MTALGVPAALVQLDVDLIRRTYSTVLGEARLGRTYVRSEKQRAHLAGLLRGQLRLALRDMKGRVTQSVGETRRTAEHVIARADAALALDFAYARQPDHLHDLAVVARSLLTLHQMLKQPRTLRAVP